jgi:hypothetical protein
MHREDTSTEDGVTATGASRLHEAAELTVTEAGPRPRYRVTRAGIDLR